MSDATNPYDNPEENEILYRARQPGDATNERPGGPSKEWLLKMADAEDRCGSVAVGVSDDGGEYLSPTAMRLLRSMAGLGDDARWIDVAPVLSSKLHTLQAECERWSAQFARQADELVAVKATLKDVSMVADVSGMALHAAREHMATLTARLAEVEEAIAEVAACGISHTATHRYHEVQIPLILWKQIQELAAGELNS